LDGITLLGDRSDWNRLVFQFVTKSWDDHELLKSAESLPLVTGAHLEADRPVLAPDKYERADATALGTALAQPALPQVQRDWMTRLPQRPVEVDAERLFGVVARSESGYDGVARALLSRKPETLPRDGSDLKIAQVGDSEIIVFQALNFERPEEWALILKDGGELLLEAKHAGEITPQMLLDFKSGSFVHAPDDPDRCRIYSLTDEEVLMRYRSIKIRWTPQTLEVVTREYADTREFWEFLYGPKGVVLLYRLQVAKQRADARTPPSTLPPNEQLREDYLFVLRDYKHLSRWFSLLINRNLRIWGRVTCQFRNKTVLDSALAAAEFKPENENPVNKEEAEAISLYRQLNQPCVDYYGAHGPQIESELMLFVAKNGEFPPAVEDGGIFGLHEITGDLQRIKRDGLKQYMRQGVREA
jgi:hypothetical protein